MFLYFSTFTALNTEALVSLEWNQLSLISFLRPITAGSNYDYSDMKIRKDGLFKITFFNRPPNFICSIIREVWLCFGGMFSHKGPAWWEFEGFEVKIDSYESTRGD